jgi:hypothetical protein
VLETRHWEVWAEHIVAAVRSTEANLGAAPRLSRPGARAVQADGLKTITEREHPEPFRAWEAHHAALQLDRKPNRYGLISQHRFTREASLYPPSHQGAEARP